MYENAKVKTKFGNGVIVSDVKCQGIKGETYLLQIQLEGRHEIISLYDDEVIIKYDG